MFNKEEIIRVDNQKAMVVTTPLTKTGKAEEDTDVEPKTDLGTAKFVGPTKNLQHKETNMDIPIKIYQTLLNSIQTGFTATRMVTMCQLDMNPLHAQIQSSNTSGLPPRIMHANGEPRQNKKILPKSNPTNRGRHNNCNQY